MGEYPMPGPEFFQTPMGRRFYDSTMPRLAAALEVLAKKLPDQAAQAALAVVTEEQDLLSIFLADEESRYRQAREEGFFYGVSTLNRLCRYWKQPEVEPLKVQEN